MQIRTHNSLNVVLMNYLLENNYLEKDEDNFALFLTHCAICVCTIPGGVFFYLSWNAASSTLIGRKREVFLHPGKSKKSCPKCLIHFLEITLQSQKQSQGGLQRTGWSWNFCKKSSPNPPCTKS